MKAIDKRRAARGQSGFTLIELLVVIAILGILAGVVVFAVGNTTTKSKATACKTEARTIKTAIASYNGIRESTDTALTGANFGSLLNAAGTPPNPKLAFMETDPSVNFDYNETTKVLSIKVGGKYDDPDITAADCGIA